MRFLRGPGLGTVPSLLPSPCERRNRRSPAGRSCPVQMDSGAPPVRLIDRVDYGRPGGVIGFSRTPIAEPIAVGFSVHPVKLWRCLLGAASDLCAGTVAGLVRAGVVCACEGCLLVDPD